MAEQTSQTEKQYIIPLRKSVLKVPRHERTRIAIRTIKRYIAKHMKVPDRNLQNVKLDVYLNNDLWFKGKRKPPAKIKVKATKSGELVKVDFLEIPDHVKFLKSKVEKRHKKPEKKPTTSAAPAAPTDAEKPEDKETKEEKTPEEKKEEKEKSQAVAEQRMKQADQAAKAQKHTTKAQSSQIQRKALKK